MKPSGLRLSSLKFTGPERPAAELKFWNGTTLIWGASNTGKSFALEAIDFMLGASGPLPDIRERAGYTQVGLTFSLGAHPNEQLALTRGIEGGAFLLSDGRGSRTLAPKHDGKKVDNVSAYLLQQLGLHGKWIVQNSFGKKRGLSFRDLSKYALVDETAIQAKCSPVESGQRGEVTEERSVFRLLLSGIDDAEVVTIADDKTVRTSRASKLELLDELIRDNQSVIHSLFPDGTGDLREQANRLNEAVSRIEETLAAYQGSTKALIEERSSASRQLGEARARLADVELHLERFAELDKVYASDLDRLEGLEEVGFLLSLSTLRECSLCGALPEHQAHPHAVENAAEVRAASLAEIDKVKRLRVELETTVAGLREERERLLGLFPEYESRLATAEARVRELDPHVRERRRSLAETMKARDRVRDGLALVEHHHKLVERRRAAEAVKIAGKDEKPRPAVSSVLVHDFCNVVSEVLTMWEFPGDRQVSFDERAHDLRIGGKLRVDNGKGVRAVTHAAFKVALLIFCHRNGLAHPGFLVLDTPLMTYRDPIVSKHGELEADESVLARTPLRQRFFEHLHEIRDLGQFIVLENVDLPVGIESLAHVEVFAGAEGRGRAGLFP